VRVRQQRDHRSGAARRRRDDCALTAPPQDRVLPAGFALQLDAAVRRPTPEVLVGGNPLRVLRLTKAGGAMVDRWSRHEPVGRSKGAQALAARLLDSGLAHPRPCDVPHPLTRSVSIVIPVRDQAEGVTATLESLPPAIEVVVVDDGSRLPVVVPAGRAAVLRNPVAAGPAAARNRGAAEATGEVIVFVDAECQPEPGWLDILLPHFADPSLAAVAPRIRSRPREGVPRWLAEYEERRSSLDLGPEEAPVRPGGAVSYVPTAALAVRRAALEAIGGFDERLRYGEDVDLVWRLAKAGWRVRYDPAATVTHPVRATPIRWLRQRYNYGRSAASLAARHGRDVAPVAMSPWSSAAWAFAATGHPVAGAAIAAATTAALAKRAGSDIPTARVLVGLALAGHARAAAALGEAARRAWLPVLAAGAAALPSRRARRCAVASLAAAFVVPPVTEWVKHRPRVGLPGWVALRWADDLAYQTGVWAGMLQARSLGAILPRW
jgi:mycofactocin glycosyltransferase